MRRVWRRRVRDRRPRRRAPELLTLCRCCSVVPATGWGTAPVHRDHDPDNGQTRPSLPTFDGDVHAAAATARAGTSLDGSLGHDGEHYGPLTASAKTPRRSNRAGASTQTWEGRGTGRRTRPSVRPKGPLCDDTHGVALRMRANAQCPICANNSSGQQRPLGWVVWVPRGRRMGTTASLGDLPPGE